MSGEDDRIDRTTVHAVASPPEIVSEIEHPFLTSHTLGSLGSLTFGSLGLLAMTSFFQVSRLTLRAILVASLLVLGHFLLISAPSLSSNPELVPNLKATSAILFHSLLWTVFVLFEEVDLGRLSTRDTEESGFVFVCTATELVLNSLLTGAWIAWSRESSVLIQTIIAGQLPRLWMMPLSYALAITSISLLQLQLVGSILRYAVSRGPMEVFRVAFWRERAGHWEERIALSDDEEVASLEKA